MNSKGFLSIIFSTAIFIFLLSYAGTAIAGSAGPFASGHGNLIIEGERRTFSFHARELKNGRVIGSLVLKNRSLWNTSKSKDKLSGYRWQPGNYEWSYYTS